MNEYNVISKEKDARCIGWNRISSEHFFSPVKPALISNVAMRHPSVPGSIPSALVSPAADHAACERGTGAVGMYNDRLSGLRDLLCYAGEASILDIGINRGLIAFEFARRGAAVVHGCDIYRPGVDAAREIFTEMPTTSRFEVIDLARGPAVNYAVCFRYWHLVIIAACFGHVCFWPKPDTAAPRGNVRLGPQVSQAASGLTPTAWAPTRAHRGTLVPQ
jgi:hypothetical protein